MEIGDLLHPDQVIAGLRVSDKTQLTAELSRRAAAALQMPLKPVEAALTARERLGSTGLGRGFALPHARMGQLDHFFGLFARLARPIDFDAIDERPVDLVFLLLIPESAGSKQVAALAAISRRMRDQAFVQRLRKAASAEAMYAVLTDAEA
ncbi:MAG: PTS sugar transporter subunit IIA [Acetobacteraceae bacterium]|nr:PTS sugar transporter subunit IIA [Acetobacteraceae bacterium]